MKTIGLIGGMSWESTALYYQWINQAIKARLGGLHSAKLIMVSLDFAEIESMQMAGDWDGMTQILSSAGQSLKAAGADCVVICTNTMHKIADPVEIASDLPLLHIADATALRIQSEGYRRVGLLGTGFTMSETFYKGRLQEKFSLDVLVPNLADQELVHSVIYNELCLGKAMEQSRESYLDIVEKMRTEGAEAVILGCTEITLLINQSDTTMPLLDTTAIHAESAADFALKD